jgi:hypothetical protein
MPVKQTTMKETKLDHAMKEKISTVNETGDKHLL